MATSFQKAPLVEIIAELRWTPTAEPFVAPVGIAHPGIPPAPFIGVNLAKFEQFLMRFGGEVYQHGFQRAERIVPPGFPTLPFQPIVRYHNNDSRSPMLYQAGLGLFTTNALPPYKTWESMSPVVRQGISALLNARDDIEKELPFTRTSLRYINAFSEELTGGRSISQFMEEVFGISIRLPDSLARLVPAGQSVSHHLQMNVPLIDNSSMFINIGDGMVNNEPRIMMDMTAITEQETPPEIDRLMALLSSARDALHETFFALTKPITAQMAPVEE